MSETRQDDPWATVRTFTQTRTGLWPSDSGMWYCRTEVDAARAAEATQHRARLAAVEAERDRLKAAAQAVLDNGPCADPDCCTMAIKHEAALQTLRAALSGEGTKP